VLLSAGAAYLEIGAPGLGKFIEKAGAVAALSKRGKSLANVGEEAGGFARAFDESAERAAVRFDGDPKLIAKELQDEYKSIVQLVEECGPSCSKQVDRTLQTLESKGLTPKAATERINDALEVGRKRTDVPALQASYVEVVTTCAKDIAQRSYGVDARAANSVFCDRINLSHVFEGQINNQNKGVGFHYLGDGALSQGKARIKEVNGVKQIVVPPDAKGFYVAEVEIFKPSVGGFVPKKGNGLSTMFPDHWTPQEVFDEILDAFANAKINGNVGTVKFPNYWEGVSKNGNRIGGYLIPSPNGGTPIDHLINTAYPII
jgi:Bacterial EndoU nuclease